MLSNDVRREVDASTRILDASSWKKIDQAFGDSASPSCNGDHVQNAIPLAASQLVVTYPTGLDLSFEIDSFEEAVLFLAERTHRSSPVMDMSDESSEVLPLVPTSTQHNNEYSCCRHSRLPTRFRRINIILTVVVVLQSLALLGAALTIVGLIGPVGSNTPYSPARNLLRSEVRVFSDGLKDVTLYQGNDTKAEQAWEELYLGTTMRLSREQALQLPNRTLPIHNDKGYYIAQLDVFHELHCLNSIRRLVNGDKHPGFTPEHMSHCLDSIRQYIMCNVDVSVIVWNWDSEEKAANPAFTHPHKCFNFEEIQRWAKGNRMLPGWDKFALVEDDLPEPSLIE